MVKKLNCLKYREKSKKFKVPYYTSTAAARDGNLPYYNSNMPYCKGNLSYIIAICLYF